MPIAEPLIRSTEPAAIDIPLEGTLFEGLFDNSDMCNAAALVVAECQKAGEWIPVSLLDVLDEHKASKGKDGKYSAPTERHVLNGLHQLVAKRMLSMSYIDGVVHITPTEVLMTTIRPYAS